VLVVAMDVLFHVAPQIVIPLFVPALCIGTAVITTVVRRVRGLTSAQRASTSAAGVTERAAAGVLIGRSAPSLHSALVIRQLNSTDNSNTGVRRAYASTL